MGLIHSRCESSTIEFNKINSISKSPYHVVRAFVMPEIKKEGNSVGEDNKFYFQGYIIGMAVILTILIMLHVL